MSKNKKGASTAQQLSPEKYVRTQARTLPLEECLVTADWQQNGICTVVIARRHKTGNFTVGTYLIDLYCLGLKDTSYQFNISPDKFNFLKTAANFIKCDYALAHNIICGGIAFAEDYGFKPHKDFATTKFILEEDDEDVEFMDVDFGLDGMPCYMRGPYDNDVKVRSIEAALAYHAGPGNYTIVDAPGSFELDEDEDFWDDGYDPIMSVLENVSKEYDELIRTADSKRLLNDSPIGTGYELTSDPIETEDAKYDSEEEAQAYIRLHQMVISKTDMGNAIKKLKEAISRYPGKSLFYNLLQSAYTLDCQADKSDEIIYEMTRLFPGYLYSKIAYANLLIDEDRLDEVLAVFDGKPDLNYLYPHRQLFHETEASAFFGTMCRYYLAIEDLDAADAYMNAILKYDLLNLPGQTIGRQAMLGIFKLKLTRLKEVGKVESA